MTCEDSVLWLVGFFVPVLLALGFLSIHLKVTLTMERFDARKREERLQAAAGPYRTPPLTCPTCGRLR